MSMEEKTTTQASDSTGNEEGEEVSKRVVEKEAISETEKEGGGENGSDSEESAAANGEETGAVSVVVKRRRGRPRKNSTDGEQLVPVSSPQAGFLTSPFHDSLKRGRGRPRGSGRLQFLASQGGIAAETAGGTLTPHILNVPIGEDIASIVSLFSRGGPRAVCILSATGDVSVVYIRQPGSTGSILRYEGRFEILTLSGSCLYGDKEGKHCKRGVLTVSLAKPDRRVFGGEIAGSMIAASPVRLILGSFKQNITKEIKKWNTMPVLSKQGGLSLLGQAGKTSDAEKKDGIEEVSSQALAINSNPNPSAIELNGNGISL